MSDYYNYCASEDMQEALGQEFEDGKAIAYDYDCFLLERETPKRYVYTALNRFTGRKFKVLSSKDMAMHEGIINMMDFISHLDIAGPGRLQADRPVDDEISNQKAWEILDYALNTMLPAYNYIIDDEQKERAAEMFRAVMQRSILPVSAGYSDIDIICCLIAAVIIKRGRINDYYARRMFPLMQYADMPRMPIVFSVPSIAVQRRVARELLPKVSEMLLNEGIIWEELTFVERKGRENYVCKRKAKNYSALFKHRNRLMRLSKKAFTDEGVIELDDIRGLTQKEKDGISVDRHCADTCPQYESCKYAAHLEAARGYGFDIQICTHRYLIADSFNRKNSRKKVRPLIPNSQMLIICDTNNYMQTAEDMLGTEIPVVFVPEIWESIKRMAFRRSGLRTLANRDVKKLTNENMKLFKGLASKMLQTGDDGNNIIETLDEATVKHLANIRNIADRLIYTLYDEAFFAKAEAMLLWAHKRFGINAKSIKLNTLLSDLVFMNVDFQGRVKAVHEAICNLFEMKKYVSSERVKRTKRRRDVSNARKSYLKYIHNTENEAIANMDSYIYDMISDKTVHLFEPDTPFGKRSERILTLIKKIAHLRDQIAVITELDGYSYRIETGTGEIRLRAVPDDIGKKVLGDWQKIGMPTVLMSGKLPEGVSFDDFKQTLGIAR